MNSLLGGPLLDLLRIAEDYKPLIAALLRRGEKLSEMERHLAAFLIDGEVIFPEKKKGVGRPPKTNLNRTDLRNISIALEYEYSYEPSSSEACFEQIKDKYKFKSISTAKKAVERGRKLLGLHLSKIKKTVV